MNERVMMKGRKAWHVVEVIEAREKKTKVRGLKGSYKGKTMIVDNSKLAVI